MRNALIFTKIHRFEFILAVAAPLLVGAFGLFVLAQLNGVGASDYCIPDWLIDGPATRPECAASMQRWGAIAGGGIEPFFIAMSLVMFGVGLVAGVPIVARELEGGSAAFTWWLFPNRVQWLVRQTASVGLPLLVAGSVAALVGGLVAAPDHAWGTSAFSRIGLHGPDAVARMAAAFGVGVLIGSLSGRSLPGLVVSALLVGALALGITLLRNSWVASLELTAIGVPDPVTGELVVQPRAVFAGWGMQGDTHVMLGVTEASSMGWEPIETGIYASVAIIMLAVGTIVVRKKRPR